MNIRYSLFEKQTTKRPTIALRVAMMALVISALMPSSGFSEDDYDPITFELSGNSLIARGEVGGDALAAFGEALYDNPDIDTLVLQWVPGSVDDDASLLLARTVNSLGLKTIVPEDGLVSSAGTDLFLAGTQRVIEPGACIGVHSWGDSEMGSGIEIPRDAPVHRLYLRYYDDIDISQEFYWYTLEAAGSDDMHWMTPQEQKQFSMATEQSAAMQVQAEQCDQRTEPQ